MSTLLHSVFTLSSIVLFANSLGQVGGGGFSQTPGINDWDMIVNQPEVVVEWTHSYQASGVPAGTSVNRNFVGKYKCWEDLSETSDDAPWTSTFAQLYDWTSQNLATATANSNGICVWTITWQDSWDQGQNGIQKWRQNPSLKCKQRRVAMLHPVVPITNP